MKRNGRQRLALLAVEVLLSATLVGASSALAHISGPQLVQRSVRILNLKKLQEWTVELGSPFEEPIWLSEHQALAHSNVGDGFLGGAYWIDVRTGRKRRLEH